MITILVFRTIYLLICLWTIWRLSLACWDYSGGRVDKASLNIIIVILVQLGYWMVRDAFITFLQIAQQFQSVWE